MTVFLIILAVLLGVMVLLLLSVAEVDFSFDEKVLFAVRINGLKVYSNDKPKKEKKEAEVKEEKKKKPPNFFEKMKNKHGFSGTIRELFEFAGDCLKKVKKLLSHLKLRKLFLDISVGAKDAATVAVEYGAVCSAVYPVLSFLNAKADVKLKKVNIRSDFNSIKPEFKISFSAKLRVVYILIAAIGLFSEYKKFKDRNDL